MKQYESNELAVLVPQAEIIAANGKGESHRPLRGGPFITVTLEELRELFIAAVNSFNNDAPNEENFKSYLQSKGINIITNVK